MPFLSKICSGLMLIAIAGATTTDEALLLQVPIKFQSEKGSDKAKHEMSMVSRRLYELPASEPHHICMTGKHAKHIAQNWILSGDRQLSEFKMPSKLAPENECSVWEHVIGHSLVTVSPTLYDRCAARFKVHSSSCDVLVHADQGEDCEDLYKLRAIADQPHAILIVLQSDSRLMQCYNRRASKARNASMAPLTAEEMAPVHLVSLDGELPEQDFRKAMLASFAATRKYALARYADSSAGAEPNFGDASRVRTRLLDGTATRSRDVMFEFLKQSQGYRADASSLRHVNRRLGKPVALVADAGSNMMAGDDDYYYDALVLDVGSTTTNAGFAGDDVPIAVFPTVVGKPRVKGMMKDVYGDEAMSKRSFLYLKFPMSRGYITSYDDWEAVVRHTLYNELSDVKPENRAVLLTESPLNPKGNREKMTQIMFEKFNVAGLYISIHQVLALYESGRTTGIVVHLSDDAAFIVPIYEGYALPHAINKLPYSGHDTTSYLINILTVRGQGSFTGSADWQTVRDFEEEHTYVAEEQGQGYAETGEKTYELSDGQTVTLGNDALTMPGELLFDPTIIGLEDDGIHKATYASIMDCDVDIRKDLYANIVLSGGTTLATGFADRLKREVTGLAPPAMDVDVIMPKDPKISAWLGGSILTSLPSFKQMWITREEYDESGPSIVHRKCF